MRHAVCGCGRKKDVRSQRCARCANLSRPIDGSTHQDEASLRSCIERARSLTQAAASAGVSRHTITRFVRAQGIDLSHMVAGRGRVMSEDVRFCIKQQRDPTTRRYFRDRDPDGYKCEQCGLGPSWNNAPLTLQLDHRNGDCCDDRLENLRWLCPNCHSQTDTYTGRNAHRKERGGRDLLYK